MSTPSKHALRAVRTATADAHVGVSPSSGDDKSSYVPVEFGCADDASLANAGSPLLVKTITAARMLGLSRSQFNEGVALGYIPIVRVPWDSDRHFSTETLRALVQAWERKDA